MKVRNEYACIRNIYTVDVFPKYIEIHGQASPSISGPTSFDPHDHNHAFGGVLRRPYRRHRAGGRAVGAAPTALGLLVAANGQMAGPPSLGDPCPLELRAELRGPIASRSGWRHREDLGES